MTDKGAPARFLGRGAPAERRPPDNASRPERKPRWPGRDWPARGWPARGWPARGWPARAIAWIGRDAAREIDRLPLWTPVLIGGGVWLWFWRPGAPDPSLGLAAAIVAVLMLLGGVVARRVGRTRATTGLDWLSRALIALAAVAIGFAAAQWRADRVAAPIWPEARSGDAVALSARVRAFERTARGAPRLLLDRILIDGPGGPDAPERIRVTTPGLDADAARALVGRRIGLRARLFPPPPPVEPGALDLPRRAYFEQVGAYGRGAATPRDLGPAEIRGGLDAARATVQGWRAHLSARARAVGEEMGRPAAGGIVAALLVGDRTAAPAETVQALRDSNLAHLLAISGLHMALVSASLFAALRLALALPGRGPFGADPKKVAALAAIAAAALYLALSGGALATQRAFIMAAVAFGAVLLDRPAVTLRAVAFAACVILLYAPESLLSPGFQLSFAATTALVAAFEAARPLFQRAQQARAAALSASRRARAAAVVAAIFVGGLIVSSLVAGLATAPFAALFFNRLTHYGLIANLAAAPAMGAWIMPAGVAAIALAPLGLETAPLQAAALGVSYVLWVAETVAAWPGAVSWVRAGDAAAGWIVVGGLALALAGGWIARAAGLAALAAAAALWSASPRPDVLIAPGGRLIGVAAQSANDGAAPRALDRPRAGAFAASVWLRRDGLGDAPETLAAARARGRRTLARFGDGWSARLAAGARVELNRSRRLSARALETACRSRTLLILPRGRVDPDGAPADCVILDQTALGDGVAVWTTPSGGFALRRAGGPPRPWSIARPVLPP